ncbi:transposase, partial [Actinomyces ruminicola]
MVSVVGVVRWVLVGVGPGARGGVRVRHKGRRQLLGPIEKPHDSNALPTAAGGAGAVCADLGHFVPTRTGAGAGGRPPGGQAPSCPARRHAGVRHHAACREQLARLRPGARPCKAPGALAGGGEVLGARHPCPSRPPAWTGSLQLDRVCLDGPRPSSWTGLEGCFRTWGMAVVPRDLIVRMMDVTKAKYSEEFREQVAREVVDKERSIASVAASYGLVAQTVGNWVAKYRKQHADAR